MGSLPNNFYNFRCEFDDTAQYHASAMNVKGEVSVYASLVVKSRLQNISFNFFFKMHITSFGFVAHGAFTFW